MCPAWRSSHHYNGSVSGWFLPLTDRIGRFLDLAWVVSSARSFVSLGANLGFMAGVAMVLHARFFYRTGTWRIYNGCPSANKWSTGNASSISPYCVLAAHSVLHTPCWSTAVWMFRALADNVMPVRCLTLRNFPLSWFYTVRAVARHWVVLVFSLRSVFIFSHREME